MISSIKDIPDIFFLLLGAIPTIIVIVFLSRSELKRRKEGFVPTTFGEKFTTEYTPQERRFSKIIGLFVGLWTLLILGIYFMYGQEAQYLLQLLLIIGIITWGVLIKFGNKKFNKNKP